MMKFAGYLLLVITAQACNSTDHKQNYRNSGPVTYNLIKVCVDTLINKHSEINTTNYVLDLSSISMLNQEGVEKFMSEKNSLLPTTIDDSTLITGDKNGHAVSVKKSMLIKILAINDIEGGLTKVQISKIISQSKKVDMSLYLKRFANGYNIYSCQSLFINNP